MSRLSTIAMWVAVVLLIGVYVFPLWTVRLQAPQYPQGLGIDIWIYKITGAAPHDLQNINGLNHYIGMKKISPDAIPELRFMKWVLGALIALGAIVALARRRWLFAAWVVLAIVLSTVGMFDFYKWEYSYGHELNPEAAIKVPGMTYQPPMFGSKQLLNFTATAWPGLGGVFAMLAVGISALILIVEALPRGRSRRAGSVGGAQAKLAAALLLVSAPLVVSSCSRGPRPIEYGVDVCDYCMMSIADNRFGAEIVTTKGRAITYDSIECMAMAILEEKNVSESTIGTCYATDFGEGTSLIDVDSAVFLHSPKLQSPMGKGLAAFSTRPDAERVQAERGGDILDWGQTQRLVQEHESHDH